MVEKAIAKLNCPRCGQKNSCQSTSLGEFSCWCQQLNLSVEEQVWIRSFGFSAKCLCQACLKSLVKEMPKKLC